MICVPAFRPTVAVLFGWISHATVFGVLPGWTVQVPDCVTGPETVAVPETVTLGVPLIVTAPVIADVPVTLTEPIEAVPVLRPTFHVPPCNAVAVPTTLVPASNWDCPVTNNAAILVMP